MGLQCRVLMVCLVAVVVSGCGRTDSSQHVDQLRQVVSSTPAWVGTDALGARLWKVEQAFYADRGYLPLWVDGDRTTPRMKDLLQQLRMSDAHGLVPASYGVDWFTQQMQAAQTRMRGTRFDAAVVPELDARLTYAYLRYAADLLGWTHSARDVYPDWLTPPRREDLGARLTRVSAATTVRESLEELAPTHSQYKGLQMALAAARGSDTGDVQRIRMNMERWRWAPRDLGARHVLINVPAYQMQVIEGGQPVLAMRVIVGAPEHSTPLFSDEMTYVVFSPYWNIPESILREETLPKVARDPAYLDRNAIEVVGTSGKGQPLDPGKIDWDDESETRHLRFRQRPGPENALGLVKFIFPNHFSVYLHDTPSDALFFEEYRALSHGCIRVENPVALAQYVLADQRQWTAERISEAMHEEAEKTVRLKSPLPVHIGYWTAWVEPDGRTVTYLADPYGIDTAHARLLQ